jgi:hypothetical protein
MIMFKGNRAFLVAACLLIFLVSCEKTEPLISTADRDKFLGTWNAISTGVNGTRNFTMQINASTSSPDQIIIKGFDGGSSSSNLPADVNGNNVTLITTIISGETISGSGSLNGDTLRFNFTVDDGQTVENRTCKAWK